MDMITLAMAKAYSNKKGGYIVKGTRVTWDGNIAGKETNEGLYKISDTYIPYVEMVNNLKKITVSVHPDLQADIGSAYLDALRDELVITAVGDNGTEVTLYKICDVDNKVLVAGIATAISGFTPGVYVACEGPGAVNDTGESVLWISDIVFADTIHPILPEFIPPLDSLTLNGADGKQYKLSVDESGQLVTAVVE